MKFAIALAALATTTLATPALAGPYVETKSEFKGTDEDFGSQVHQARVGYDWRMGIATPYIETGAGTSIKDGGDSSQRRFNDRTVREVTLQLC